MNFLNFLVEQRKTQLANTPYRHGSPIFSGSPLPAQSPSLIAMGSDGQLLLPVSGNHADAPVPVPIEGRWGFLQLDQRQQVELYSPTSLDVGKFMAVFD